MSNNLRYVDGTGAPMTGCRIYMEGAYMDAAFTIPHPNPIISDSEGAFPAIFLCPATDRPAIKARLETSEGEQIWERLI